MFKSFVRSLLTLLGFLPGAMATLRGLIEASEKVGFNKSYPQDYEKIINLLKDLLYVATEQWPLYIIVTVLLAFFWALVVAEPKAASKRKFEQRKIKRIGKRR